MVLTDKQISDILRDAAGEGYTPHEVARILESEIKMKHREMMDEIIEDMRDDIDKLVQHMLSVSTPSLIEKAREMQCQCQNQNQ